MVMVKKIDFLEFFFNFRTPFVNHVLEQKIK